MSKTKTLRTMAGTVLEFRDYSQEEIDAMDGSQVLAVMAETTAVIAKLVESLAHA